MHSSVRVGSEAVGGCPSVHVVSVVGVMLSQNQKTKIKNQKGNTHRDYTHKKTHNNNNVCPFCFAVCSWGVMGLLHHKLGDFAKVREWTGE